MHKPKNTLKASKVNFSVSNLKLDPNKYPNRDKNQPQIF